MTRTTAALAIAAAVALIPARAAAQSLGYFEAAEDVGQPALAGSTKYDADGQTYTITGGGTNMWATRDEFQFAWRRLNGDFILRAHVAFQGAGVDPHRKIGWIIRQDLTPDSPYVDAAIHGDGLTSLQYRKTAGGITAQIESAIKTADVVQLERRGGTYIMSVAKFGDPFTVTETTAVTLPDEVYVGLFVCSHNPKVQETAVFSNVRIDVPPKTAWTPYRDYIGSNLEIMTVATGARTVLHTSPISIQAPNWTVDGKSLIFNGSGRLHRLDLATRAVTPFDTGFATRNNNDHVFTFDGTLLGISHHSADDNGRSVIYSLPGTGGTPKRITANSPSYFHGWSPDNKWLIYTGLRNGNLDIYKISADGGDEIRLTSAPGVDDGSEYTPDGQWIFFNSTRTGLMQVWKMRPDGSEQTQVTNDQFNNWFPHIAPDSKSMVVISYGQDTAPGDHPFYKHVYLRHMGLDGSSPKVVAYLFGGQGTINVPSWSPDSTKIGFVSNSALPVLPSGSVIFDGKTLTGWHKPQGVPADYRGGKWDVVDGTLVGDQDPPGMGGFLVTDKVYRDFVIEFEVKLDEPADSGVFLRMGDDGRNHQLTLDNDTNKKFGDVYLSWGRGTVHEAPEGKKHFKQGEWNRVKIQIQGEPARIQFWLNGRAITDFQHTAETTSDVPKEGRIGLQIHAGKDWSSGSKVRFRHIRVTEL